MIGTLPALTSLDISDCPLADPDLDVLDRTVRLRALYNNGASKNFMMSALPALEYAIAFALSPHLQEP